MDILTTDAAIPIRTRTTGRTITDTTVDRRFIGPVVIACIIRADIIGITGIGNKPGREPDFTAGGVRFPPALFFR